MATKATTEVRQIATLFISMEIGLVNGHISDDSLGQTMQSLFDELCMRGYNLDELKAAAEAAK